MSAGVLNVNCEQGSTWRRSIAWKSSTPPAALAPVNLTGYVARAMVRVSTDATIIVAVIACTIPAPLTGVVEMRLTAAETSAIPSPGQTWDELTIYVYDLEVEAADGTVTRLLNGYFSISPEVTR